MLRAFPGWRWKIGLAVLILGVLSLAAWGRSHFSSGEDSLEWSGRDDLQYKIALEPDGIWFAITRPVNQGNMVLIHAVESHTLPYWSLIIPLTLLAAVLLLIPLRRESGEAKSPSAAVG